VQLHFGFDLDNTLINYNSSALAYSRHNGIPDQNSINSLRGYLLSQGSEKYWTQAQSWIYTSGLATAEISHGAVEVIRKLVNTDFKISIISHKTEFGPFQYGKVPLRATAIEWLENSELIEFFPNLNNIYFTDSLEDKIGIIRECKLSHYVDDLIKIFLMDDYPKFSLKSFLFKPSFPLPDWLIPLESFDSLIEKIKWL
jgi:hypothetical protein